MQSQRQSQCVPNPITSRLGFGESDKKEGLYRFGDDMGSDSGRKLEKWLWIEFGKKMERGEEFEWWVFNIDGRVWVGSLVMRPH